MLEVLANAQVNAKLATGSVASSGCISDNILFALVTFRYTNQQHYYFLSMQNLHHL